jgi:16S rRNA (uracil1498-N3)-methyltransferase
MFSERDGNSLSQLVAAETQPVDSLTAVVGSEGGWTDEELALARERGWQIVTLGGRTLRAETAAIAVTTLLQHLFGDLK